MRDDLEEDIKKSRIATNSGWEDTIDRERLREKLKDVWGSFNRHGYFLEARRKIGLLVIATLVQVSN